MKGSDNDRCYEETKRVSRRRMVGGEGGALLIRLRGQGRLL